MEEDDDGWDVLETFKHQQSSNSQHGASLNQITPDLTAIEREMDIWNHVIPRTKETKVEMLSFWKKQASNLPLLSWLAKKILCIPVSSASSERVFSEGGRVISSARTLLNPDTAEDLIWMHQNYDELAPLINHWVTRWSEFRKKDKVEQEKEKVQASQEQDPPEEPEDASEEELEGPESKFEEDKYIIDIPDDDENDTD